MALTSSRVITKSALNVQAQSLLWRKIPKENETYIESIMWQIVESPDTSLLQFRSGGLDITRSWPWINFQLLKVQENGEF